MAAKRRLEKDQRYRERCFPGVDQEVFKTERGFVPLPIVSRKLLKHLENSELRVWLYLQTRASRWFICYPTYEEILQDTGLRSRGTISKAIRGLERKGFTRSHNDAGTRRYLLRDPRLAAQRLCELGEISEDELDDINDLLDALKLPVVEQPKRRAPVVPLTKARTTA